MLPDRLGLGQRVEDFRGGKGSVDHGVPIASPSRSIVYRRFTRDHKGQGIAAQGALVGPAQAAFTGTLY